MSEEQQKFRRVRNSPPGAMSRSEFAAKLDVTRQAVWKWQRCKLIKAQYVFAPGYSRVFFLPKQIDEMREQMFWRSGKGMRIARNLVRRKSR
jgi:hypothetical protein